MFVNTIIISTGLIKTKLDHSIEPRTGSKFSFEGPNRHTTKPVRNRKTGKKLKKLAVERRFLWLDRKKKKMKKTPASSQ